MAIRESGVQFDVIFGPAYKGIPLATTLAMAWCQLYGENKEICYNRKEVKDHGEVVLMRCKRILLLGLLLLLTHYLQPVLI
jgi:orotate phosphoribosyltransferase